MTNEFKMRPKAEIGDLVTVGGYGTRVWKVDAYDMNLRFESGIVAEEITYEVVCVDTGEYDLAWHEDVTLFIKADNADAYLRDRPASHKHGNLDKFIAEIKIDLSAAEVSQGSSEKAHVTEKGLFKAAKELARTNAINLLLDERNKITERMEEKGANSGKYAKRVADIDAKLKRIAGGE